MLERLRREWRTFLADPAGQRFRRRRERHGARGGGARKGLVILGGCVLIAIGVALLILPGPGLVVMLLGAGLIAEESLGAARGLDRIDAAVSPRIARWRARHKKPASPPRD